MDARFDKDIRRAIRLELARESYASGRVRLAETDLAGFRWLVTTHKGLYAVSPGQTSLVAHGWFFGIDLAAGQVFYFENCAMRYRSEALGRIVSLDWDGIRLSNPRVLVTGLHGNCHQLKVIEGLLCLVDTANQRILRFDLDGRPFDIKTPLPVAPNTDTTGSYAHINSIAEIDGKIALLLHNGKAQGPRKSEIVWLDQDWNVATRAFIEGYQCHDIIATPDGLLWHSASQSGEVINSIGGRIKLSDTLMTRAIAMSQNTMLVGLCSFGDQQIRDSLAGEVIILDRQQRELSRHELPAGPADAVALR
jgi:hypothetical protein